MTPVIAIGIAFAAFCLAVLMIAACRLAAIADRQMEAFFDCLDQLGHDLPESAEGSDREMAIEELEAVYEGRN